MFIVFYDVSADLVCLYASLIGSNPRQLRVLEKWMSSHAMELAVYKKLFLLLLFFCVAESLQK